MDLRLPEGALSRYRSPTQQVRVATEDWAASNLFCVACDAPRIVAHDANTRVEDFACGRCGSRYQLKAERDRVGRTVRNSAYEPKIAAIRANRAPHYTFLAYDRESWSVTDAFVVPGHFLVESVIARRKPLAPTARRAGWVGSNILLGELPPDARVTIVTDSVPRAPSAVRRDFARFRFLGDMSAKQRGWTADVLACIRRLDVKEFALADAYRFEDELQRLHPENRNVQPKIRQQLQVLRDRGVLEFVSRGRYRFRDGAA